MARDLRRLAAIVSADVVGYSRLMGRDESATLGGLKAHRRQLIDPKIAEHAGRIVKTTGDGLLLEFPSVVDAVRCAVDVQRGMKERNVGVPEKDQIQFRLGINVGDIIIDDDDIFGDGVNVAARLQTLADPGGICVSRAVRDHVLDKLSFGFEDLGAQVVKNIARPIEVYRIRDEPGGRAVTNLRPVSALDPDSNSRRQPLARNHRFDRFELLPQPRLLLEDGRPVEIGARAFDLLLALVERSDRLVTKSELLDLAWPGLVVEENNLQVQINALRKVLGHDAIKTVPGRGYQFALEAEQPPGEPAAANGGRSVDALPRPLTSFVGRESDLDEYARLLQRTRLLTLTGIGGCGKTRLAIELARSILASFPDGVWFVDLAPVAAPERIAFTVAAALNMGEEPDRLILDTVCTRLEGKRVLLVLDNCEHLVAACAVFVEALLGHTANATVLATSRERLGVAGEQAAIVRPLGVAPLVADRRVREASEAVRLFVDRARLAAPDLATGSETLFAVDEICRRLEGLPLAIELAAARVKLLSVDEINARLSDRFRLLTAGGRTQPRHQTLRGVIDWSYAQLEQREQEVLRRLSVFAGGWSLAAASFVVSMDDYETIDRLERLVDKSLVLVDRSSLGRVRYRMLETVRDYALDRLLIAGELHETRRRHLHYFAAFVESTTAEQGDCNEEQEIEFDNLMAAHDWCDIDPATTEPGLSLGVALARVLRGRVHPRMARTVLVHALGRQGKPTAESALTKALLAAGDCDSDLGDHDAGSHHYHAALEMARRSNDRTLISKALWKLSGTLTEIGNLADARRYVEESLALARTSDSPYVLIWALNQLGEVCRMERNLDEAALCYEETYALSREHGDETMIPLLNLAIIANERRDYAQASRYLADAAVEIKKRATEYYKCWLPLHAAALAAAKGDAAFAARMWGAAEAIRTATGLTLQRADLGFLNPRIELSRAALGDTRFNHACEAGRGLLLDDAIAEIDTWLAHMDDSAPEDRVADRPTDEV